MQHIPRYKNMHKRRTSPHTNHISSISRLLHLNQSLRALKSELHQQSVNKRNTYSQNLINTLSTNETHSQNFTNALSTNETHSQNFINTLSTNETHSQNFINNLSTNETHTVRTSSTICQQKKHTTNISLWALQSEVHQQGKLYIESNITVKGQRSKALTGSHISIAAHCPTMPTSTMR